MKKFNASTAAYLSLLIVMAGRTALFVSNFDQLLVISLGSVSVSVFALLMAVALIISVSASASARAVAPSGSRERRTATSALYVSVSLDGLFNVAETIMIADTTGIFDQYVGAVRIFLYAAAVMIGVGPTLLTTQLAALASIQTVRVQRQTSSQTSSQKKTGRQTSSQTSSKPSAVPSAAQTKPSAVQTINRTSSQTSSQTSDALDAHIQTVSDAVSDGETFRRTDVERITGLAKAQAATVIKSGKSRGVFTDGDKLGVYMLRSDNR